MVLIGVIFWGLLLGVCLMVSVDFWFDDCLLAFYWFGVGSWVWFDCV